MWGRTSRGPINRVPRPQRNGGAAGWGGAQQRTVGGRGGRGGGRNRTGGGRRIGEHLLPLSLAVHWPKNGLVTHRQRGGCEGHTEGREQVALVGGDVKHHPPPGGVGFRGRGGA